MQWSADGWQSAFRIELRVAAVGLATRGWPVLPGTYPAGSQWAGRGAVNAEGPTPVPRDWPGWTGTDLDQVTSWWTDQPYSLLVATGTVVRAIEVTAARGHRAAARLRTQGFPVPIVATPDRCWYFLIAGNESESARLCPELADDPEIMLHGAGSWIPMPPTTFPHGVVHWRVKPEVCGWRLPSQDVVEGALCAGTQVPTDVADLVAAGR